MISLSGVAKLLKHLLNVLCGIYISSVIARLLGWMWPEAEPPAFILLSLGFVLTGVSIILRERNGGEESTVSSAIAMIPVLVIGTAVAIGLGKLTARFWTEGFVLAIIWSVVFCAVGVGTFIRDGIHKRKLDADLKQGGDAS